MMQSIYTSVSNADVVPCRKGQTIKSEPIPLLRDKYLGEYRTELEKAKVRKNLGIPDENSMSWGNIEGFVEEQKDLVTYVESKWLYLNEISESITNVKEALDYAIYFISNYKTNDEAVKDLNIQVQEINKNLVKIEEDLQENINKNSDNISEITEKISEINISITQLNEDLKNINVDANILNWVSEKLKESQTLYFSEVEALDVKISEQENNAIVLSDGLYVKDFSNDINTLSLAITEMLNEIQTIEESTLYSTQLSDDTQVPTKVGGIEVGTTVASLKGKTLTEILDTMLFPTTVRTLIQPRVSYSYITNLVKVGDPVLKPTLTFIQNDAGPENNRIETITLNDTVFSEDTYSKLGTYFYKGVVSYDAGQYLVDNKGQVTNKRIEAGSIEASTTVTATYPWYVGNSNSVSEQTLVRFNQPSGDIEFTLSGQNACIKLPGTGSTITTFKLDGGMGYLDVDLAHWIKSTETINGITYQVWTKKDSYAVNTSHKINFKLEL